MPASAFNSERISAATEPLIDCVWAPGPARPSLAPGAAHIWLADLSAGGDELLRSLSRSERQRAASFLRERDGLRWARSRGILRALLGRYLGVDPCAVSFRAREHGKPYVERPLQGACMAFNLSHSGALALYALSNAGAVGVDVQISPSRPIDELAIASRRFGAELGQELAGLAPEARRRAFLRAWTRHEAVLKCNGASMWDPSGGSPAGPGCAGGLWVASLELSGATAAVAVARLPSALRCFAWTG